MVLSPLNLLCWFKHILCVSTKRLVVAKLQRSFLQAFFSPGSSLLPLLLCINVHEH